MDLLNENLETKNKQELLEYTIVLQKFARKQSNNTKKKLRQARVRGNALKFASNVIANNKLIPNKTADDIYKMLLAIGRDITNQNELEKD